MRQRLVLGKTRKPLNAGGERRKIGDIKPPGIKRVAGQKDAGPAIVERDTEGLVPRNRDHVQHAAAEIDETGIGGPLTNTVGLLRSFHWKRNHCDVGLSSDLRASGALI